MLNIPNDFQLQVDELVIHPSTYEAVAALHHPLDRLLPPAVHLPRFHYFVVVRSDDSAIVSSLDIEAVDDDSGTISMSWATSHAEQRKGYASRSARALAEWLHQQRGVMAIEVDIVPGNEARDRTAFRAGFVKTTKPGRWEWRP